MKNYFVFFTLIISFTSKAQQKDAQPETSNQIKTDLKPVRQASSVSYTVNAPVANESDEYYGRKEEFSRMFISGQIPAEFPKYKTGGNVDEYNIEIKTYFKKNTALLTDKYKEKYGN